MRPIGFDDCAKQGPTNAWAFRDDTARMRLLLWRAKQYAAATIGLRSQSRKD